MCRFGPYAMRNGKSTKKSCCLERTLVLLYDGNKYTFENLWKELSIIIFERVEIVFFGNEQIEFSLHT